jgi:hypothetical protein
VARLSGSGAVATTARREIITLAIAKDVRGASPTAAAAGGAAITTQVNASTVALAVQDANAIPLTVAQSRTISLE